jgi:catechol 2,3-dioxygenase-like lactoylglutathione lyase family enzyme
VIIDHFGLGAADFERARAFHGAALAPLGIARVTELGADQAAAGGVRACGFGRNGKPEFWIGSDGRTTPPAHIAFLAGSQAQVRAVHEAALGAGGRDNGPPGLRPEVHADYYAAFVIDPDGHDVEAVCHAPERAALPRGTEPG